MSNTKLDSINRKIQALQDRTMDRGCTENEALEAARKLKELMEEYDVSMEELESIGRADTSSCKRRYYGFGTIHRPVYYGVVQPVADYCEVRWWLTERFRESGLRESAACFYGLPVDLEFAEYLMSLLVGAINYEWIIFRRTLRAKTIRNERRAFQYAMSERLGERITQMARERHGAVSRSTALVLKKFDIVDANMKSDGIELRETASQMRITGTREAIEAGRMAGDRVNIRQGLGSGQAAGRIDG